MQHIKIITDVDGVLFDSVSFRDRGSYHELWRDDPEKLLSFEKLMSSKEGYKLNRYGRFRHVLAETVDKAYAKIKDEGLKINSEIRNYANEFSKITRKGVIKKGFFPGVIEALNIFKRYGYPLFAVSGSEQDDLEYIFNQLNITRYFKKIYGFTIASGTSLQKEILFKRLMINEKDLEPFNYIYIGDTVRDLIDANKMGFDFIGIANSKNDWKTNAGMKNNSVYSFYEAALKICNSAGNQKGFV